MSGKRNCDLIARATHELFLCQYLCTVHHKSSALKENRRINGVSPVRGHIHLQACIECPWMCAFQMETQYGQPSAARIWRIVMHCNAMCVTQLVGQIAPGSLQRRFRVWVRFTVTSAGYKTESSATSDRPVFLRSLFPPATDNASLLFSDCYGSNSFIKLRYI